MKNRSLAFFLSPLLAALAFPAFAQDVGRVSPATLPLPAAAPMPPDRLRAHNPWNMPKTGSWKFQLTYGQIKAGQYQTAAPPQAALSASNSQADNPPENAFDGTLDTRWCATGGEFPQWLQADLGKTRRVSGANLTWEHGDDRCQYKIEGRAKSTDPWKTLADRTTGTGFGDGPVDVTPADMRYVRVTITGTSGTHWASLREFQIRTTQNTLIWDQGLTFVLPPALAQMAWQRDSFFTDYPAGHLGEPSGTARAGDTLFRASKRGLHWLTLTDNAGMGLALLPTADTPLVGHASASDTSTVLFASREVAADNSLSGSWVTDHPPTRSKASPCPAPSPSGPSALPA